MKVISKPTLDNDVYLLGCKDEAEAQALPSTYPAYSIAYVNDGLGTTYMLSEAGSWVKQPNG